MRIKETIIDLKNRFSQERNETIATEWRDLLTSLVTQRKLVRCVNCHQTHHKFITFSNFSITLDILIQTYELDDECLSWNDTYTIPFNDKSLVAILREIRRAESSYDAQRFVKNR